MTATTHELPAARSNGRSIALWLLSGLLAFAFVGVGSSKLAGAAAMVELFDKVALGQWFRYVTGALEVGGGLGLLVPGYAFYAAVLLALVMTGAVISHLTVVGGSPVPAGVLLILTATIAYLRKP